MRPCLAAPVLGSVQTLAAKPNTEQGITPESLHPRSALPKRYRHRLPSFAFFV
jgi:hypothetical protein